MSYLQGVQVFLWGPEIKRQSVNLIQVRIMNSPLGNTAPVSCDLKEVPYTLGACLLSKIIVVKTVILFVILSVIHLSIKPSNQDLLHARPRNRTGNRKIICPFPWLKGHQGLASSYHPRSLSPSVWLLVVLWASLLPTGPDQERVEMRSKGQRQSGLCSLSYHIDGEAKGKAQPTICYDAPGAWTTSILATWNQRRRKPTEDHEGASRTCFDV